MAQEMSFAQALNEAKQVILQQSNRIKADLEKIKSQQQTIVEQCAAITQQEQKLREQSQAIEAKQQEFAALEGRVLKEVTARSQAEAVVDRQGERITSLQSANASLEQQLAEQAKSVAQLTQERDNLQAHVPSKEDEEALASLSSLLTRKAGTAAGKSTGSMRIGGNSAGPVAEAA